jgi:hypothetical protein
MGWGWISQPIVALRKGGAMTGFVRRDYNSGRCGEIEVRRSEVYGDDDGGATGAVWVSCVSAEEI